jgi:hypothetical protein
LVKVLRVVCDDAKKKKKRTGPNIDAMEKVAPASESRRGDGEVY